MALIVAYYLSKFDLVAKDRLGYNSFDAAFKDIGARLSVNPNSVKNMRDEFDPVHENSRVGWHQRPLRPIRRRIAETLQDLSELSLTVIVTEILGGNATATKVLEDVLITPKLSDRDNGEDTPKLLTRGLTGRKAEDFFVNFHDATGKPVSGNRRDARDISVGFDFEIRDIEGVEYGIIVNGLSGATGSISLTDREWNAANRMKDRYFLFIVSEIDSNPSNPVTMTIRDPASKCEPNLNLTTIIQANWVISASQLKAL